VSAAARPVQFFRSSAEVRPVKVQTARMKDGTRKSFVRRWPDNAQTIRRSFQVAFALLNLWIGAQFYFWVRYYETGGATVYMTRPPGVEGWLPIAALMNLKYWLMTGLVPEAHAAGMFLLVAFLAISLLFRKAFCSWLCPVGTISEWLWQGGRDIAGRSIAAPRWLDVPLRSLKYILLSLFAYVVITMPPVEIRAFLDSPYGVIADVKMLDFFRRMGQATAITLAVLVVSSLFVKNVWCRYLCPYGAMLGLVSLVGPARIRRDAAACIDCDKCTRACPSLLPVAKLASVKSPECTACLECVTACPSEGALRMGTAGGTLRPWIMAAGIAALFLLIVGGAQIAGHWHTSVPDEVLFRLVPRAAEFGHP
jgi:polyferredoxin